MKLATCLPHEPGSVAEARRTVDRLEGTLDPETVANVRLLVSELVTNSVRHGGGDECGDIELSLSASPETLRVEVANSGDGFVPRSREEGQDQGSGWGIYLLEALSHRWGTDRDGVMRVWFEIDAGPTRKPPEPRGGYATLSPPPASEVTSARKALESATR